MNAAQGGNSFLKIGAVGGSGTGPYSPSSFTSNQVLWGNGTGAIQSAAPGGSTITDNGSGAQTFTAATGQGFTFKSGTTTAMTLAPTALTLPNNSYLKLTNGSASVSFQIGVDGSNNINIGGGLQIGNTAMYIQTNGTGTIHLGNGVADWLTLNGASSGNATFAGSVTTAAGATNAAGAWKLGALRTSTALVVSTTQGIQLDVGGTLYTMAVLSTNP